MKSQLRLDFIWLCICSLIMQTGHQCVERASITALASSLQYSSLFFCSYYVLMSYNLSCHLDYYTQPNWYTPGKNCKKFAITLWLLVTLGLFSNFSSGTLATPSNPLLSNASSKWAMVRPEVAILSVIPLLTALAWIRGCKLCKFLFFLFKNAE